MPAKPKNLEIGVHNGKRDFERVGLFAEMGYLHGKGYTSPNFEGLREMKGRQIIPGFPKWKTTGLQDCYFDTKFKRLFIGEGPGAVKRQKTDESKEKDKKEIFKPTSYTHLHSTPGDFYGCFTGPIKSFDPRLKKEAAKTVKPEEVGKIKFIPSSPGKKGGYGYNNTTISPFPKYIATAYEPKLPGEGLKKGEKEASKPIWKGSSPGDFFDKNPNRRDRKMWQTYVSSYPAEWTNGIFKPTGPAKMEGGCKDGCFDKFPKYMPTRYVDPFKLDKYAEELAEKRRKARMGKGAPVQEAEARKEKFLPPSRNISYPVKSVLANKIQVATNAVTWKTIQPVTYTREFY